ncbi:divergent PAP2 family protein [Bacillus cereus]|nr:divergent PAP2 family protein [Bacillus cereus]
METILHNDPLMAAVISWFLAQLTKVVFKLVKTGEFDFAKFFASGVGVVEGVESSMFAVATIFAIIVMYDASGVRLAVSKQAKILNDFFHGRETEYKKLNELVGHTPYEVVVGALLGIIVGVGYCL